MQLKTTAPSDDQTLSEVFSQMLTNDTVNQVVDDTAVLDTGIGRGNVVKYSSASGKWVLCDGTVKLNSTDTVGIVEYASGTSGQVRTSGVYLDATLTSTLPYYCQADGTLGVTVTKVFMGCIASSGRFMMASGSGGGVQPATVTELGGVMVGNGLAINQDGVLSAPYQTVSITSGTVAHGGTIPLPSGYTRGQCKYAVWPHNSNTTNSDGAYFTWIDCQVDQGTGLVYCSTHYRSTDGDTYTMIGTAGYLCIGVK